MKKGISVHDLADDVFIIIRILYTTLAPKKGRRLNRRREKKNLINYAKQQIYPQVEKRVMNS